MKLSSFNDGSKDGQLIVVSKDLTKFVYASDIALTMQAAMDNCCLLYTSPSPRDS